MLGTISASAGIGDVNGDGFDDVMIGGHPSYNGSVTMVVKKYLILGRTSGWGKESNVSLSHNGSFVSSKINDRCVFTGGRGDINGDGYDDILIGGPNVGEDYHGAVYLFFGKNGSWHSDTPVTLADRIYTGKSTDQAGCSVAILGDLNLDGYDDIAIGAPYHDEISINDGCAYIIYGNSTEWRGSFNLVHSDFTFYGERRDDRVAWNNGLNRVGDVNGDGYNDIQMGSRHYNIGTGKTYIVLTDRAAKPTSIDSVTLHSDMGLKLPISKAMVGDRIYVELVGEDGDPSHPDQAFVTISTEAHNLKLPMMLKETGKNTGHYTGNFLLGSQIDTLRPTFDSIPWYDLAVTSSKNPSISSNLWIEDWITLFHDNDEYSVNESEEFRMNYSYRGINGPQTWDVELDGAESWLTWDEHSLSIKGIPNNSHVGSYSIQVKIFDGYEHFSEHTFILEVINKPPRILNNDLLTAIEDQLYIVDYNSDQDGQGTIEWACEPEIAFLSMGTNTGVLTGTPGNGDVGTYDLNVSVYDGNGGWNWSNFQLIVKNVNDPPTIYGLDILEVEEDDYYLVRYTADDIDPDDENLIWLLDTSALWLKLDRDNGTISGIPKNDHVGSSWVNISVMDDEEAVDYHNFTLTVHNTNDPPIWMDRPEDIIARQGDTVSLSCIAVDPDIGDMLSYSIETFPTVEIDIDPETGIIEWMADTEGLSSTTKGTYSVMVTVTASDGEYSIKHDISIEVNKNPAPISELIFPFNGTSLAKSDIRLQWEGYDPDEDNIQFVVFMHRDPMKVMDLDTECLIEGPLDRSEFIPEDLEVGAIYYWTVIPIDLYSTGTCLDGIFSFHVNTPPVIVCPGDVEIEIGKELNLKLIYSDPDVGDRFTMILSLIDPPSGMILDKNEGWIRWAPEKDAIGDHIITIQISDRKDNVSTTLKLTVYEAENDDPPSFIDKGHVNTFVILILSIIGLLILISIVFFIFLKKKSNSNGTDEEDSDKREQELYEDSDKLEENKIFNY